METLADRIAREGSINELDAVGWAIRLAKRLEVLHAMGVVHGSVSPKCVLTAAPERASRAVLADVRRTTTDPMFQSPERILTGNLSPADDVWAVAATLYTTLTATPPFVGGNDAELKQKILAAAPAPLAVFDVGDDDLQHILDAAFNRDLARRTTSVGALRRALEDWHPDPNVKQLLPLDDDDESTDHSAVHGDEGNDEETVMKKAPIALQQLLAGHRLSEGDSDEDEVKTVMREIPQTLQELLRRDDTHERPGVNAAPTPVAPPPGPRQQLPPSPPGLRQPTIAGTAPVGPPRPPLAPPPAPDRPPLVRQSTATQAAPIPGQPIRQITATGALPIPQAQPLPQRRQAPPIDDEESSDDAVRTVMLADALAAVGLAPPQQPPPAPPPPIAASGQPTNTAALPAVDDNDEDEVRTVMREAPQVLAQWQAALGPPPAPPPPTPPGEGSGSHPQPMPNTVALGQAPTMALDLASMVSSTLAQQQQQQPPRPPPEVEPDTLGPGGGTSPGVSGVSDWRPPAQTSPLDAWDPSGFGPHGTSAMPIVGQQGPTQPLGTNPGVAPLAQPPLPNFAPPAMPQDVEPAEPARRSGWKLFVAAVIVLIVAAAGTWAFLRYRGLLFGAPPPPPPVGARDADGLSNRCIVAVNPPKSTSDA